MSVLTHSPDVFRALREQPNAAGARPGTSSHIAMIKRFAKFTLALAGLAIVATAIASLKLAIYWPRLFH
jgi:predicted butyrate kinase (DUF1464 family)